MVEKTNKIITHYTNICTQTNDEKPELKTYKYRWVILLLYGFTMVGNGIVIFTLYMITDLVCNFYQVSKSELLIGASLCNGFTAIFIPTGFLPSKYGLRASMVFGSGSLAICGGLFLAAAHPEGYIMFVVSLVFAGISTGILFQLVSEISAVWFPMHQHALATSINLQMQGVGVGLGCLGVALLFDNKKEMSIATVYFRIKLTIYLQSSLCIVMFFLNLIFFMDKPKLPPSISQAKRQNLGAVSFLTIVKEVRKLIKNPKYVVLAVTFGITYSLNIVYPLIMNSLVVPHYQNGEKKVSIIGILVIVGCSVGSIVFGSILDKTKHYKYQTILQLIISLGLGVVFNIALLNIYKFYILCICLALFWFFYFSTLTILTEMIAEVTYPINNSIAMMLCFFLGNIFGITLIQISGWLVDDNKENVTAWMLVGTIGLQLLLLSGLKIDTKRSNVEKMKNDLTDDKTPQSPLVNA